jgi:UDP-N-acetylglucosamine 2-epimerase
MKNIKLAPVIFTLPKNKIISGYREMIQMKNNYKINLYGNGEASKKIISVLME